MVRVRFALAPTGSLHLGNALGAVANRRYADEHMAFIRDALQEPTARRAVEALLRGYVASVTDTRTPPGCLTIQGGLASGPGAGARVEAGEAGS